ncbi:MAG: UDP-N-acetylglucosamine pyrophosphorylase [Candidatus Improbicoccus devescovinae]|nr:MAG: UDP-N-acetylglucosamine pyrophosphorylase [Candidatus Improbicoccus devescovinae]
MLELDKIMFKNILDLSQTLSSDLFEKFVYPWEVLNNLEEYILNLGSKLPKNKYQKINENVWIAYNSEVNKNSEILGPSIIDEYAKIKYGAYIRGSVIIGKKVIVGTSSELKKCILFNKTKVPHFNYVGDSILGYKSHLGAGAIISNVRSDKKNIKIKIGSELIETGVKKLGGILGDNVEIGCNAVVNPGSIVGRGSIIYPLTMVRGFVPEAHILKNNGDLIKII